jgi:hypothetical protein
LLPRPCEDVQELAKSAQLYVLHAGLNVKQG